MANRFPLIVDTSDSNKIKEIPSGDNLQLSGNDIIGVVNITGSGTLTIESISATNITKSGTPLATVATSGSYDDLSDTPTNVSTFTNDSNYVTSGSNVSVLTNDAGYLTTVAFGDLTSTPTTLAGYGIADAATSAQGTLADSAIQPGDNVSTLNNDAGYITLSQVQSGSLTIDVNNSGDLIGSVFSQDSTLIIDGILGSVNLDGTIRGHLVPLQSEFWDLGSSSNLFRNAYISGTLNGNTAGVHTGDTKGSVFADDSTILVDGVAGKIVGSIDTAQQAMFTDSIVIQNGSDIVTLGDGYGASFQLPNKSFSILGGGVGGGSYNIAFTSNGSGSILASNQFNILGGAAIHIGTATGLTINNTVTVDSAVTAPSFVGDVTGSIFADDSSLLVDAVNGEIPGYVKIADLKTALQDGAGDYAAFKAWVLANL